MQTMLGGRGLFCLLALFALSANLFIYISQAQQKSSGMQHAYLQFSSALPTIAAQWGTILGAPTTVSSNTAQAQTGSRTPNPEYLGLLLSIYGSAQIGAPTTAQFNSTHALGQSQAGLVRFLLEYAGIGVGTVEINESYGTLGQGSVLLPAGSTIYYFGQINGTAAVMYEVKIVRAVPKLTIYVDGARFSGSNVTVHVPIIGNRKYYSVTPYISSSMIGNNIAQFSYTVSIAGVRQASANFISGSFRMGLGTYNVPSSDNLSIRFDTQGNSNYTPLDPGGVTVPTGIVYYMNITLDNAQSSATPAPFQQMVTVNSLSNQTYEAANLDNIEFFYSNSVLIQSWLEGNAPRSATPGGASSSSTNTVYWLNIANGIPASATMNVEMGFAPTSTNLFDGVTTGEAPQLSPSYAQYDDGNNVFPFYDDFFGTSLSGLWNTPDTKQSIAITVDNGLTVQGTNTVDSWAHIYTVSQYSPSIVEEYLPSNVPNLVAFEGGFALTAPDKLAAGAGGSNTYLFGYNHLDKYVVELIHNTAPTEFSTAAGPSAVGVYSGEWPATGAQYMYTNYTLEKSTANTALGYGPSFLDLFYENFLAPAPNSITVQWVRARDYPPSGVMPSTSFGAIASLSYIVASPDPPPDANTIGNWTATSAYPAAGEFPMCANDTTYVYCAGGAFSSVNGVYYAQMDGPGLGAWQTSTPYPLTIERGRCTIYSGYDYCVGGQTKSSIFSNAVYSISTANLQAATGSWLSTTPYTANEDEMGCATNGAYLYCAGGLLSGSKSSAVEYASLSSGTVGTWTATNSLPHVTEADCGAWGGYMYCVAGPSAGPAVYYAPFLSPGPGLGAWSSTSNYPISTGSGVGPGCAMSDGTIFCVGGAPTSATGPFVDEAYSAPILSGGGLGAWQPTASYKNYTIFMPCVGADWYVYCIGGKTSAGKSSHAVYYAPIANGTIEPGQESAVTTVLSGGAGPYIGNWVWTPPASSGIPAGNTVMAALGPSGDASMSASTLNAVLTITANAFSSTQMQLTFNGVTYSMTAPGSDTIGGTWTLTGYAQDSGANTITGITNTIYVYVPPPPQPISALPNPFTLSNTIIDVGQSAYANTVISGAVSPYYGGFTIIGANNIGNNVVNTIAIGGSPEVVAFSPDSALAYVARGVTTVSVIDTATNTVINTITVGTAPENLAFSPSGAVAYVANKNSNTVSVIDPATNAVISTINVGINPQGVAFSPGGTIAYVANFGSNTVNVIDVATNAVINTIPVGINPQGVAFNPQGTIAYVTNNKDNTVSVIDVATATVINTIAVGASPFGVAFNPSGTLAYVSNKNAPGTVSVIDPVTNTVINTITVGDGAYYAAFNPQGTLAYVVVHSAGLGNVIDVATNTVINTITVGASPYGVAFNPQGTLAYVTNNGDGTVSVIAPPETATTGLPANNELYMGLSTISGNTMTLTNSSGAVQTLATGTNTLYGMMTVYGFAEDGTTGYGSGTGTNTITVSNTITINPAQLAGVLTETNTVINSGQYSRLAGNPSGGTTPYTISYFSQAGCAGTSIGSGTSLLVNPTSTTTYSYNSADSATTSNAVCSASNTVTVNAAPSITAVPSPPLNANTVGNWTATSVYPIAGEAPDCATDNTDIYCVGGAGSGAGNTVYYASVNGPGLGAWTATNSYPIGNTRGACVIAGGYDYCVGGKTNSAVFSNAVYSAQILGGGGVTTWSAQKAYPANTYMMGCVPDSAGAYVYCAGGSYNGILSNAVWYASLSSGAVGTWTSTNSMPANSEPACGTWGGYMYCVAGGAPTSAVYYAQFLSPGPGLGAWSSTSSYPIFLDIPAPSCALSKGTMFCMNGQLKSGFGTYITDEVYAAPVLSGGGLGAWQPTASYPFFGQFIPCLGINWYIYCMLGKLASGGGADVANVFYAPIANQTITAGQASAVTTVLSGGAGPYIGNWVWTPPASSNIPIGNTVMAALAPSGDNSLSASTLNSVLTITGNAFSSAEMQLTFNGVTYTEVAAGTNTIGGTWTLTGYAKDSGTNTISSLANTITVYIPPPPPCSTACLLASPDPFTLSNTAITAGIGGSGEISIANTVISNAVSPYYGGFTVIGANGIGDTVTGSINVGAAPRGVAFNPQGTIAYVTDYNSGTVNVINPNTGAPINSIAVGANPQDVAFNPQGTLAYVTDFSGGTVNVISVATNTPVANIVVGPNPYDVAFNPQGTLAYVTDNVNPGTVNVISVATNTPVANIVVGSNPTSVAFNPQGTLAYVVNQGAGTINVINVATSTAVSSINVNFALSVSINPQGTLAYVTQDIPQGTVTVISLTTNNVINSISVGSDPWGVAFNPQGTLAYVVDNTNPGTVNVINVVTNTSVANIIVGSDPYDVAFNPQGTLAYITNLNPGVVSVITPPETAIAALPANNALTMTVNAISFNTIGLAFNGAAYTFSTSGTNTISGPLKIYAFAEDSTTGLAGITGLMGTNTITMSNALTISAPLTCTISLTNSLITFGSGKVYPGSNTATGNQVIDSDALGAIGANIVVEGSNWVSGANTFFVANTLWNPTSAANGIGNALTLALVDTRIYIPAGASNNIYFGVSVPNGQAQGAYSQSISIENSC